MKIITVEEHFMSESVNDRFRELNPPRMLLRKIELDPETKENIAHRNAEKLFKLPN